MDKTTETVSGVDARKKILAGVNKILAVVAKTLGPAGQAVLMARTYNRGPRIVDDGYFAAENVLIKDPFERLAADSFKEGIKKTNELGGDGTTGTAIVSGTLVNKILGGMSDFDMPSIAGVKRQSVRSIRKELNDAKDDVIKRIKENAKPVTTLEELEQIACISIGKEDEQVAKLVAKMVWEVARDEHGNYIDNHIDITEGYKGEIETEVTRGMRFPSKVPAPAFVTRPEKHEMVCSETPVLITTHKIDDISLLAKVIDTCKTTKLAIFSPDFSTNALIFLSKLNRENNFLLYPIKCPALRTVQLEDLAAYTDAKVIDKDKGDKLKDVLPVDLGYAEKIVVKETENREDASLMGGRGEKTSAITDRVAMLKGQLAECRTELEKISLEKRIANLGSAVGVIRVGASTSGDGMFIKMKIEDGVYACKGALEEGYVKGGGLCLKEIAEAMPDNILTEALKAPYEQIQKNAGGIEIGDDVIDPAKVVRMIVEHGVTVAGTLITTHAIVAEVPEKTDGEGMEMVARAIAKFAYFTAKHQGMLRDSEIESESDRQKEFERVLFEDRSN